MQRWKYFVAKDETFDWVKMPGGNVASGAWATGMLHPARPTVPAGESAASVRDPQADAIVTGSLFPPTPEERSRWELCVFAMRSVSRRVMGHRPSPVWAKSRPAKIEPQAADAIAAEYVAMLRPRLRTDSRPLRTLDRLALDPAVPSEVKCFGDSAAVLWQIIFGSMLPGFGVPVCGDCGAPLPDSPSGKRSRAERCRKCRQTAYQASIPLTERRRREREKKRKQRAES